ADGTGVKFVGTELITEDRTVYAIYTVNEYIVTFIDGLKSYTATVKYDAKLLANQIPAVSRTGYTFKNWNFSSDGTAGIFNPLSEKITKNVTVYAMYDINEYAVTFIDVDTTTVVNALYNTKLDQSKVPTAKKEGYTFKEWNTSADGTGTSFNPVEAIITENITVYAIYTKDVIVELVVTFIDGDTTTVVNALYNTKLDQSK
ncbi:MAG: InlB B-repeat-containing protein, partial [Erysipelothrix sp.]